MARVIRSKWFAISLFSLAMVVAGIGGVVSSRAPAGEAAAVVDCVDCSVPKQEILNTGDPAIDLASRQAAAVAAQQRKQAYMEEELARAWKKYNMWHGTKAYLRDGAGAENRDLYDAVARIFANDLTAPEGRLNEFSHFLGDDAEFKVIGWRAGIVSVTPNENGWRAMVRVGPTLASKSGGIPYTPHETLETWQIAEDGDATVVDVRSGDEMRGLIITD